MTNRLAKNPQTPRYHGLARNGRFTGEVRTFPEKLSAPLHWKKPRRIFVQSMGDLFHEDVPDEYLCKVFDVIRQSFNRPDGGHRFQVLTKRPCRALDVIPRLRFDGSGRGRVYLSEAPDSTDGYPLGHGVRGATGLTNYWIGVTTEDQQRADERIPILLKIPAAVRFVSVEPLLGPVDLNTTPAPTGWIPVNGATRDSIRGCLPRWQTSPMRARLSRGIDWVICGSETGPGARPMDLDWARKLRNDCVAAGVPFFFKKDSRGNRELDGQKWQQFPEVES
uniref:DUF5131 family protein n=1 Tax=viral metagenome TaxID=1070528 RepID=A0A6M3LGW6_9ZZZZ